MVSIQQLSFNLRKLASSLWIFYNHNFEVFQGVMQLVKTYMFFPNQEPCPVCNRATLLPGSGAGYPVQGLDKHVRIQGQGLGFRFRVRDLGLRVHVTIIVIRFQNRTAGLRTGCPVPDPDNVLDRDRTYTSQLNAYHIDLGLTKFTLFGTVTPQCVM